MTARTARRTLRRQPGERDGAKHPRCGRCGTTWRQSGDRTGHCTGCHRTFDSLAAFDRHQHIRGGAVTCDDPAALPAIYEARVRAGVTYWRVRMTEAQAERFARLQASRAG